MVKFFLQTSASSCAQEGRVTIAVTKQTQHRAEQKRIRKILGKLHHLKFEENLRRICGEFAQKRRLPNNDTFKAV
jgi:hypothetical protein